MAKFTLTIGELHFMPKAYQGFRVGPFTAEVETKEGESIHAAYARIRADLTQIQNAEFVAQRDQFHLMFKNQQ